MGFAKICVFGLGYIGLPTASTFANHGLQVIGVDVWEAVSLANLHPRVEILHPGPGVGGHCISVDPWFLVEAAPDLSSLIRTARQVNDTQPQFKSLVPSELAQLTPARRVVDAINGWPVKEWQAAGFEITRLGASAARPLN